MNFDQLFASFKNTQVLIVGDVMLDTYWWGNVDRISPEAPVPVVALNRKEYRVGGAANVALNTASLGANTAIISIIGEDEDGNQLLQLMEQKGINTSNMIRSTDRITTNKMRIMGRNQQMMRLDAEMVNDIDSSLENQDNNSKFLIRPHELELVSVNDKEAILQAKVRYIQLAGSQVKVELTHLENEAKTVLVEISHYEFKEKNISKGDIVGIRPRAVRTFEDGAGI